MTGCCRQPRGMPRIIRAARTPRPERRPAPPKRRGWMYAAAVLLLAGYLLFAHGCHRDEDIELFTVVRASLAADR